MKSKDNNTEITVSINNEGNGSDNSSLSESQPAQVPTQPRYKSWAMWASILGAVGLVLNAFGLLDKLGLDSETWKSVITALGTILTGFGIVNNPTAKKRI